MYPPCDPMALRRTALAAATARKRAAPPAVAADAEYLVSCPHGSTVAYVSGAPPDALVWVALAARHTADNGCGCARLLLGRNGSARN